MAKEKSKYNDTMQLPKTGFPMRGGLPKNEPKRLAAWYENHVYEQLQKKNEGHKKFVLHDGPPYANGPIHIGHAMNKISKDIIMRYHAMQGEQTPYVPGWDCHGQPIEHKVEEMLGTKKFNATPTAEIRELCNKFAVENIDLQREGFKRLGVLGDWDNPYLTLYHEHDAADIEVFKAMFDKGMIYRGRKPVHWCKHCHTALAEAEIEYSDEVSPSVFVRFELIDVPEALRSAGVPVDVVIWTTTPWTLPANAGVALLADADYIAVQAEGRLGIMAKALWEKVFHGVAGIEDACLYVPEGASEPWSVHGEELVDITYTHPIFSDVQGRIVTADYVTLEDGTGCVHTAPGHGVDDYYTGMRCNLPIIMPVDDDGHFYAGDGLGTGGPFSGMDTDEANPHIIEFLRERGTLVAEKKINHSYPHCWRCKNPVIFRATDQWFVSMDETNLRGEALDQVLNHVTWYPDHAKNRIGSMVEGRPDWCISRQRNWGVPIPSYTCADCGEKVMNDATLDAVIALFKEKGSDAWFTESPASYLPAGTACEVCGCTDLVPESDILDVWWESGVSHTSVCKKRPGLRFPADLYLEGSDQHRGWFQSSLLTSIGAYETAPYKAVMHCGFTVDENGHKMSKSLGNGIDPAEVMDKYGADVLRLWVASVDYSQDVSISQDILKRTSDTYRRFRNTFRFLLGVLNDFSMNDAVVEWDQLEPFDQWALVRLGRLLDEVNEAYDNFKFHHVYRLIYDYVVGDLSAVYLDALKDRLYSDAPDARSRRSAQTVLANVLEVLVRLLTPIISFTTEEVWQNYPKGLAESQDHPISVQLAGWPERGNFVPLIPEHEAERIEKRFEVVLAFRDEVTKALEEKRVEKTINKSQEAVVRATVPQAEYDVLTDFSEGFFEELLIVSKVAFERGDELTVEISVSDLDKCPRCWNFRVLGGNPHHPDVCERCGDALDAIG